MNPQVWSLVIVAIAVFGGVGTLERLFPTMPLRKRIYGSFGAAGFVGLIVMAFLVSARLVP